MRAAKRGRKLADIEWISSLALFAVVTINWQLHISKKYSTQLEAELELFLPRWNGIKEEAEAARSAGGTAEGGGKSGPQVW